MMFYLEFVMQSGWIIHRTMPDQSMYRISPLLVACRKIHAARNESALATKDRYPEQPAASRALHQYHFYQADRFDTQYF
jgi:hypothetical protein